MLNPPAFFCPPHLGGVDDLLRSEFLHRVGLVKWLNLCHVAIESQKSTYTGWWLSSLSAPLARNRTARKLQNFSQKVKKSKNFRLFDFSNFSIFSTFRAEISWNVLECEFFDFRLFGFFDFFNFFDFSSRNLLECELFDFSTSNFSTIRIFRIFRLFDFSIFSNFSSRNLLECELFDFSTFRVKLFYHGWSFQRKVAFEPPKQYTKLDGKRGTGFFGRENA